MIEQKIVKVSDIKLNPNNPRTITKHSLLKQVRSIINFPRMLTDIRCIAVRNGVVVGGNQRLLALRHIIKEMDLNAIESFIERNKDKSLYMKYWTEFKKEQKINTIQLIDFTDEEEREFVIKDNVNYGMFDFEMLANDWDAGELVEWGVNVWNPDDGLTDEDEELPPAPIELNDDRVKENILHCPNCNYAIKK